MGKKKDYLKDTTELLYNQNLEMKIAKYRLNRLVKDAGLGAGSKTKGGDSNAEPFHQIFEQASEFTKIEIFSENQVFLARLDLNDKLVPLSL